MAEIKIIEKGKSREFEYDEDTIVFIRYITKQELIKERELAAQIASRRGGLPSSILNRRLGRKAVLGWRHKEIPEHPGLMLNGKPLPFNTDNLDMLMDHCYEFSNFANEKMVATAEFEVDSDLKEDEQPKNDWQLTSGPELTTRM